MYILRYFQLPKSIMDAMCGIGGSAAEIFLGLETVYGETVDVRRDLG